MDINEISREISLLLHLGSIAYTKHAREQMKDRKFDTHDVMKVLQCGSFTYGPKKNERGVGIEARRKCQVSEGKDCEVRFTIEDLGNGEKLLRVITVVPK